MDIDNIIASANAVEDVEFDLSDYTKSLMEMEMLIHEGLQAHDEVIRTAAAFEETDDVLFKLTAEPVTAETVASMNAEHNVSQACGIAGLEDNPAAWGEAASESIGQKVKNGFAAIKAMLKRALDWVVNFVKGFFDANKRYVAALRKLQEKVKDGDFDDKKFEEHKAKIRSKEDLQKRVAALGFIGSAVKSADLKAGSAADWAKVYVEAFLLKNDNLVKAMETLGYELNVAKDKAKPVSDFENADPSKPTPKGPTTFTKMKDKDKVEKKTMKDLGYAIADIDGLAARGAQGIKDSEALRGVMTAIEDTANAGMRECDLAPKAEGDEAKKMKRGINNMQKAVAMQQKLVSIYAAEIRTYVTSVLSLGSGLKKGSSKD